MADFSNHFRLTIKELEDERIKLVPFHAWNHTPKLIKGLSQDSQAWCHFEIGPYEGVEDFITNFLAEGSYKDDRMFTFAILDMDKITPVAGGQNGCQEEGEIVGMVSFLNADETSRSVEIGLFQILPAFRSQGFASRAGRLLLQYGMTSPEKGGLGLVRMEWRASMGDPAAIKVARRLGFSELGKVRYEKLLKNGVARGKAGNGKALPPGTVEGDLWQDAVIFSMTWDDWLSWEREGF